MIAAILVAYLFAFNPSQCPSDVEHDCNLEDTRYSEFDMAFIPSIAFPDISGMVTLPKSSSLLL